MEQAVEGGTGCTWWNRLHRVEQAVQGVTVSTGWNRLYRVEQAVQGGTGCTGCNRLYRVEQVVQGGTGGTGCTGWNRLYRVEHVVQGGTDCTWFNRLCRVEQIVQGLTGCTGWNNIYVSRPSPRTLTAMHICKGFLKLFIASLTNAVLRYRCDFRIFSGFPRDFCYNKEPEVFNQLRYAFRSDSITFR